MKLVVDNSVVMRWLFNDGSKADKAYATEVANLVEVSDVSVPDLFVAEAANVISRASRGKAISQADSLVCFDLINGYDASFLLLAEKLACPLATLDVGLRKAALKRGLNLACLE